MKGSRIVYSADELAWLEDNLTPPIAEYLQGFCAEFGRCDVFPKCLDGDKTNTDPRIGNRSRAQTLPYLNGHRGLD